MTEPIRVVTNHTSQQQQPQAQTGRTPATASGAGPLRPIAANGAALKGLRGRSYSMGPQSTQTQHNLNSTTTTYLSYANTRSASPSQLRADMNSTTIMPAISPSRSRSTSATSISGAHGSTPHSPLLHSNSPLTRVSSLISSSPPAPATRGAPRVHMLQPLNMTGAGAGAGSGPTTPNRHMYQQ